MPKGSQNGAEIDATTHRKSMPKRVAKKMMKTIKHHVSPNGRIMEVLGKNKSF